MSNRKDNDTWVRGKDPAGNDFICPPSALKAAGAASEEELENCVNSGTVERNAGHLKVEA